MYHNFVFCEGTADTGDRGRTLECNFIIIIIKESILAFCTLSSLPSMSYCIMLASLIFLGILYCIILYIILYHIVYHIVSYCLSYCIVTLWWCYTTAPGTLGDTRHLLGLVSLGKWIEGFEQNREELNVYHLLSYYLLNIPDVRYQTSNIIWSQTIHHITNHQPLCKQNNNNNVNTLSPLMPCTSITCIILTS